MRIQQLRQADGDRGAVAILVALLVVIVFVMAAVAVDFGNAYAVKRKLSVSADAAALAGAAAVSDALPVGSATCDTANGVISPSTAQAAAEAAAQVAVSATSGANDLSGGAVVDSVKVTCTADDIRVQVNNSQSVPTVFGGVIGVASTHPVGTATARAYVPATGIGLKPIAACTSTVASRYGSPTPLPFLVFMDNSASPCGVGTSGNFGIVNFDDQGQYGVFNDPNCGGGTSDDCQGLWMTVGYFSRVYVPNPSPFPATPALRNLPSQPGLSASTGGGFGAKFVAALQQMPGKIVTLPVAQWIANPGNNARLGVTGLVTVRVCATMVSSIAFYDPSATPTECDSSPNNPPNRVPYTNLLPGESISEFTWWNQANTGGSTNSQYGMWVEPIKYVITGSSDPRPGCLFVNGCDLNTRAVQLFN